MSFAISWLSSGTKQVIFGWIASWSWSSRFIALHLSFLRVSSHFICRFFAFHFGFRFFVLRISSRSFICFFAFLHFVPSHSFAFLCERPTPVRSAFHELTTNHRIIRNKFRYSTLIGKLAPVSSQNMASFVTLFFVIRHAKALRMQCIKHHGS